MKDQNLNDSKLWHNKAFHSVMNLGIFPNIFTSILWITKLSSMMINRVKPTTHNRKNVFQLDTVWSECVLRIKTKSYQVWAWWSERCLIGSCEFGHPGLLDILWSSWYSFRDCFSCFSWSWSTCTSLISYNFEKGHWVSGQEMCYLMNKLTLRWPSGGGRKR